MQSTDRYAFIALMFLVVIVAVAAFWDDGEADVALPDGRAERIEEPVLSAQGRLENVGRVVYGGRVENGGRPVDSGAGRGRGVGADLPIGGQGDDVEERTPVSTIGLRDADHRVDPNQGQRPTIDLDPVGPGRRSDVDSGLAQAGGGAPQRSPFIADDRRGDNSRRPLTPGRGEQDERRSDVSIADATKGNRATESGSGTAQPKAPGQKTVEPKSTESKTPVSDGRTYVVKRGDALSSIAQRECGSESFTKELARLNGLSDPNMIVEGMTLKLLPKSPSQANTAVAAVSPAAKTARADGRPVVTLAKGDTLNALLLARYGSWEAPMAQVISLNGGLDPNKVYAGQTLVLPRIDEVVGAKAPAGRAEDLSRLAQGGRTQEANATTRARRTGNYVR